jgi:predicted kinase
MATDLRPTLYVLIGLPGCGKTTWARQNAARLEAVIVASDEIRNELDPAGQAGEPPAATVFSLLEARAQRHLAEGRNVIVDATNVRRLWREGALAVARRCGARRVAVWLDVPLAACLERNAARPGATWGDRRVPETAVRSFHEMFDEPGRDEFDEIWRVT